MIRLFTFLLCISTLPLSAPGAQRKVQRKAPASNALDQDYVLALWSAEQFLYAWATRNQYDGLALLSPKLKAKYPEEYLRSYISGVENPHHQAFEIGRGKRTSAGQLSFPVVMYEHYTGQKETLHPKPLSLTMIQAGPDTWLVDDLPGFIGAQEKE